MDATSIATAVRPPADAAPSLNAPYANPTPPVAPPELVGKFQALMDRVPAPGSADAGPSVVPNSAIAQVDDHLKHHAEVIERVAAVSAGDMSVAELQVMQMQSSMQLGMMSMTQAAYFQVLGSSKSSVSALMKNQ